MPQLTNQPTTHPSQTMKYGFASLLIFVVSTIIGGIFAKIQYNDVLANIDYIHGTVRLSWWLATDLPPRGCRPW